jgi:hypothetical protein
MEKEFNAKTRRSEESDETPLELEKLLGNRPAQPLTRQRWAERFNPSGLFLSPHIRQMSSSRS